MKADNDNEPISFITLAAATANVTRYLKLDEQKDVEGGSDADAGKRDDKKGSEHRAYVEQRLKDFAAFERGAGGDGARRQRRK